MLAHGRVDMTGWAYMQSGPFGPATVPEGPPGPAGAQGPPGAQGTRGSRWYTGVGAPEDVPEVRVIGDMYLDETTADVWRWDGGAWRGYVR